MPTKDFWEREALIDAVDQQIRLQHQATIELLKILLRQARGEWVGLKDKWRINEIVERYPDLMFWVDKEKWQNWFSERHERLGADA